MGNNAREQNQGKSMPADQMAKVLYSGTGVQGGDEANDASSSGDDVQAKIMSHQNILD